MTRSDDALPTRSQNSIPSGVEMVTVDRRTLNKVLTLLSRSCNNVTEASYCEVMLFALDNYLSEEKSPDANKAILFLRYGLQVVPNLLKEVLNNLEEARVLMKTVLDATK